MSLRERERDPFYWKDIGSRKQGGDIHSFSLRNHLFSLLFERKKEKKRKKGGERERERERE